MVVSLPLMVTELSLTSSRAPPLKWPMPLASTTVPRAEAPCSMTVLPSTAIGSATVAEKLWPVVLLFELRVSPSRTVISVPSGMVIVCATGLVSVPLSGVPPPPPPPVPPLPPPVAALELSEEAGALDLLQAIRKDSANSAKIHNKDFAFKQTPLMTPRWCSGNYSLCGGSPLSDLGHNPSSNSNALA